MIQQKQNEPIIFKQGKKNIAILILHGFTGGVDQTDLIFNYLAGKDYTVVRPLLPGHNGEKEELKKYGPNEWLTESQKWLKRLSAQTDNVFIVGISFGGNLGVSLCLDYNPKVKGLILMETPVFFSFKIRFAMKFIQPIFQFLGIEFIKKDGPFYRKRFKKEKYLDKIKGNAAFLVPVKIIGQVRKFINNRTKKELDKIKIPTLILQAEKSDMLDNKRNVKYICDHIASGHKKIYCVPIDNHDLNLLDDAGKIVMLDKINNFILEVLEKENN